MLTHRTITLSVSVCLGLVACAERMSSPPPSASPAGSAGPGPPGRGPGPRGADGRPYDPSTVETIRGQVVQVTRVASKRGPDGVHVLMDSEGGGTISVHLGPSWFVEGHGLGIQQGDTLEVTGSRVIFDGAPALIARLVVKGERRLVLRDEAGYPAWGAGGRGADPSPAIAPTEREGNTSALLDAEQEALLDALDDEYRAWTTYDQVIRDLGPERPFTPIRDAEAKHIEALRALFQRYELAMPENTWPGRVPRFESRQEACGAGVEAEVANAALYDELMRDTSRQDILAVFGNLQRASLENHLPAFRRCASGGPGRGPGGR